MNLHQIIQTNFQQNIEYFQTQHPQLFQKLSEYDSAVVNGYYAEKYELVYEDDMFDVVEKATNTKLYNNAITQYTQNVKDTISFTASENSFATFAPTAGEESVDGRLMSIEKFIFFGVGLGTHLSAIDEKIDAHTYLIVEDDLELFRLSLFVTDYKKLSHGKKLYFSVFETEKEFEQSAQNFLEEQFYYNYYIKFFQMLNHSEEKLKSFHLLVATQPHTTYFYTDMLEQMLKSLPIVQSDYNYLHKAVTLQDDTLNTKPYLLIASGPSLEANKEWLKEYQSVFTIVAVSSSLSFLEQHSINVDMIVSLDGFKRNQRVFQNLNVSYFNDAVALFSDKLNPETLALFKKENIFLFEVDTHYKKDVLRPVAPCVGSLSYQLLLLFGVKELYLLGLDMAIDATSGKTHTSTHIATKELDTTNRVDESDVLTYKQTLLEVEGNLQQSVLTTPHFASSIQAVNLSTHYFKKEYQKVYNLSNGAKFEGVVAQNVAQLTLKKEQQESNIPLYEQFVKFQLNGFTSEEKKILRAKIKYAKKLYKKVMASLKELKKVATLLDTTQEIDKVVDTYLHTKLSYLCFLENIADSRVKEVQEMLEEELKSLFQTYINALEKAV